MTTLPNNRKLLKYDVQRTGPGTICKASIYYMDGNEQRRVVSNRPFSNHNSAKQWAKEMVRALKRSK